MIRPTEPSSVDRSAAPVPLGTPEALRDTAPAKRRARHTLKGRQVQAADVEAVRALIGNGPYARDELIEYLHALNDANRCLREGHLVALAHLLRVPMVEVYEVASFYHHFHVLADDAPQPGLAVRVCDGLSCQLAGAEALLADLKTLSGDAAVNLLRAPCVGRCEHAPAVLVGQGAGQRALHAATAPQVERLVDQCLNRGIEQKSDTAPVGIEKFAINFDFAATAPCVVTAVRSGESNAALPAFVGYDAYRAAGGYQLAADVAAGRVSHDAVLDALSDAGLRGLGGAGFPVGRKWLIVRDQPAPRLLAVNIDEGEPGTFKDRTYLERDPHRFLEGVLIAAQVVGIDTVYLYVRDEYGAALSLMRAEIALLQRSPPFTTMPRLILRRGAGAYICGEESAMLESLEGKRGEPRMRPPYIAQVGLFGRPTLEHNFESLYWVRDIVQRGPAWFSGFGAHGRRGLRSYSLSGRVREPGVKLAPAGISVRELIDQYGGGMLPGHDLYAYLPGGASGGILPASLADVPLDFDTLQAHGCFIGSAAVVVLSQHDRARDAALHTMRFFADESCGQCTPCRVGTAKALALMREPVWDVTTLNDLSTVMADASICGLGQAAPNPIQCVLRYFAHEVDGRVDTQTEGSQP